MKQFAPEYPRNEDDWVLFPVNDTNRRKELFPPEVFEHPAKANIFLVEALIEYLSEPGQTVLDPFGGTGTILIAATMGRDVVVVELEETYYNLIRDTYDGWCDMDQFKGKLGKAIILRGDCRLMLPQYCDHAIFSPPYSQALGAGPQQLAQLQGEWKGRPDVYSGGTTNLARLNVFLYGQAMRMVYRKVGQSLPPGGSMAVIIKDQMRKGERIFLSRDCIRMATSEGFKLDEWHKWKPKGSPFTDIAAYRGAEVVRDEDIIIFRRV